MTECNQLSFQLPGLNGRSVEGNFQGGNVSSDGGLMLLRQVDRRLGLTKALAKHLPDQRDPDKIEHSLESMLRQRIYGLALGYEDLNDHDSLRKDLLLAERGRTRRRLSQLFDAVPAGESRWTQRSLADASSAFRTVRRELRVGS